MHPHPSGSHRKGHKRQKLSVLNPNFALADPDQPHQTPHQDVPPVYTYPTHLVPAVYSPPQPPPGPSLARHLPTRLQHLRHNRNNLSISSYFNAVSLDTHFDVSAPPPPPLVAPLVAPLAVPDAMASPLVQSLIKQLQNVDNSNINTYLLEVTRKLALSLPIDEFYNLLFNDGHPVDDPNNKIDRSSVDPDNLHRTSQALDLLLQFFKNPPLLAKYLPAPVSHLANINFHELQRTFLAFKILDEILVLVPGDPNSQSYTIPRPFIYKVYYILCQHCIAKYPFSHDRDEEQSLLLGQSKFGKLLKIAFPLVKIKRLGSRGDSKYHFLGVKWNSALVSSDTLNLCEEKEISDLKFLFTNMPPKHPSLAPRAPRKPSTNSESKSVTPLAKEMFPVPKCSAITASTHYVSWLADGFYSDNIELQAFLDQLYVLADDTASFLLRTKVKSIVSTTKLSQEQHYLRSEIEHTLKLGEEEERAFYLALVLEIALGSWTMTETEITNTHANIHYFLRNKLPDDKDTWNYKVFRSVLRHWLHMSSSLTSLAENLTYDEGLHETLSNLIKADDSPPDSDSGIGLGLAKRSLVKVLFAYDYLPRECQDSSIGLLQEYVTTIAALKVDLLKGFQELTRSENNSVDFQKRKLLQLVNTHLMTAPVLRLPTRVIIDSVQTFFRDAQSRVRFARNRHKAEHDQLWTIATLIHEYLSFTGELSGLINTH